MPRVRDLPNDVETLKRLLTEKDAALQQIRGELRSHKLEIERLRLELARLRRMQFGRSSEKIDRIIEQLELMLDELETEAAIGPTTDVSSATVDEDESAATRVFGALERALDGNESGDDSCGDRSPSGRTAGGAQAAGPSALAGALAA